MSNHTYTREFVDGRWDIDVREISALIQVALPDQAFVTEAAGTAFAVRFTEELGTDDIATLDDVVAAYKASFDALGPAKKEKMVAIDTVTNACIDAGFAYADKQFSLSIKAQIKLIEIYQARAEVSTEYPIVINTLDDTGSILLEDADDVQAFYLAAFAALRDYIDAGTTLKEVVRAATSVAEVEAVVDNRV